MTLQQLMQERLKWAGPYRIAAVCVGCSVRSESAKRSVLFWRTCSPIQNVYIIDFNTPENVKFCKDMFPHVLGTLLKVLKVRRCFRKS